MSNNCLSLPPVDQRTIIATLLILMLQFFCNETICAHNAQDSIYLQFQAQYGNAVLQLDSSYQYSEQAISISNLKFYISQVTLWKGELMVWEEQESYHLIDFREQGSTQVSLGIPEDLHYDHLVFQLGIDSITNVSGAMGGDLDPMLGMYWTWNTGYINFKLEGISLLCPTRKNEFQFHLGGYLPPYQTVQAVTIKLNQERDQDNSPIEVKLDLLDFLDQLNLVEEHTFMSPGAEVQTLSEMISELFFVDGKK